ncbi:hypothetical protein [Flavobacterium laiguense]|uniref:Uncharacterized protein n=1 Tax=Flavobacterium laiguense TaxID=2169409 RepID=A0A2U1JWE4_9FLAO|nr:hypothetical protein [Flavobacterium laiguense]PWA09527.1 hypothetical protein DB891_07545 [Flavobacterium laiguense]
MAKQGKKRTMSICLTDVDKSRVLVHGNGKKYLMIETWDYDVPDKFDNDFSISISRNKEEAERVKNGEKLDRIFIGNGRIWEQTDAMRPMTEAEIKEAGDDLPF